LIRCPHRSRFPEVSATIFDYNPRMIFKDKTVIITGGSAGIGAAAARLFADAGANLVLVARSRKNLEAIADELRDKTQVQIFPMDVTDTDACVDVFKKAAFDFGGVDILINNAGFHARGNVQDVGAADLAKIVDVNLRAPIVLTRLALPYLKEQPEAAIINVGSMAGRSPVPGSTTYAATKAALRSFTIALAEELRGTSIKVGIVSPGPVDTGFILDDIDQTADISLSQPMSTAEEVAQAILDLCGNSQREIAMPRITGFLTTINYLFPWLGRQMRPHLEKKGAKAKAAIKAERKRRESGSPGR
jgi:short-subunit dehydrogenase